MNILFFSTYYFPDGGPAAPLFTMLAESLVDLGHRVVVITTVPHYPTGSVPEEFRSVRVTRTVENGVKVIRVPLPSIERKKLKMRLLHILIYQIIATIEGFRSKSDVVLSHSPAFTISLPFILHGIKQNRRTVYSIHDVYPDVGINMGIFRSKATISIISNLEKYLVSNVDKIRVLSKSFIPRVHELGAKLEDICLIYDWVEVESIKPMKKNNAFSLQANLTETFNVLYAGNIGHVQALDTVVEAAVLLREQEEIQFVFVGEGNAKQELEVLVKRHGLNNVMFIPYQPRERMGEILASANIGLVCLKKGAGFGALPSKTFSIMSSGRPVIACVDEGSDTWEVVENSNGGIPVPPEDPGSLSEAIMQIFHVNDQGAKMGESGRLFVSENHSPKFAAKKFIEMINKT